MSWSVWSPERDRRIGDNELHIWMSRCQSPGAAPHPSGWTDAERARYAGRRFEIDRSRGLAGRGLLRRVVARYLGCSPADVQLTTRPGGKPEVRQPGPLGLSFSVSTSHEIVLVAIATGREVGIDVERVCELPELPRLATHVLTAAEEDELQALPSAGRTRWLLQRWVVKEAVLKARGVGLSVDPREIDVVQSGETTVARLGESEWAVTELEVAPLYVAAVADERRTRNIVRLSETW